MSHAPGLPSASFPGIPGEHRQVWWWPGGLRAWPRWPPACRWGHKGSRPREPAPSPPGCALQTPAAASVSSARVGRLFLWRSADALGRGGCLRPRAVATAAPLGGVWAPSILKEPQGRGGRGPCIFRVGVQGAPLGFQGSSRQPPACFPLEKCGSFLFPAPCPGQGPACPLTLGWLTAWAGGSQGGGPSRKKGPWKLSLPPFCVFSRNALLLPRGELIHRGRVVATTGRPLREDRGGERRPVLARNPHEVLPFSPGPGVAQTGCPSWPPPPTGRPSPPSEAGRLPWDSMATVRSSKNHSQATRAGGKGKILPAHRSDTLWQTSEPFSGQSAR